VEDLIVVDTGDALMICKRGSSQDVKKVVDWLEKANKKEYL
jgi:mannose-1-phosphate guanylyltransferase